MDSTFADLAVYLVPPAGHALYDVCASILGWDCRREVAVERVSLPGISAELLERWVGPAAQYGPHGTVSGWMRIPNEHRTSIVDDLARLSRTFTPIRFARGRFPVPGDFWHPRTAPAPILVAVFDEPLGALAALHAEVIGRFNTLATGSYFDDHADLAAYTARQRWRTARYHEPRVLEEFEFHISFATALSGVDGVDRLRRAIVDTTGLFELREHTTWTAQELVLFERRPDGWWRMAEVFRLGG
jgi:hypothetical protein